MTSSTRKPASQSLVGIKMLIIAMSLIGTLGGWALLAAGQIKDMLLTQPANVTSPSASIAPNNNTQSSTQLSPSTRQVNPSFRPNARTRSSR